MQTTFNGSKCHANFSILREAKQAKTERLETDGDFIIIRGTGRWMNPWKLKNISENMVTYHLSTLLTAQTRKSTSWQTEPRRYSSHAIRHTERARVSEGVNELVMLPTYVSMQI